MAEVEVPNQARKLTKNEKRRLRKKEQKKEAKENPSKATSIVEKNEQEKQTSEQPEEVEWVSSNTVEQLTGEYAELKEVFSKFATAEELVSKINNQSKHTDDDTDEDNNKSKTQVQSDSMEIEKKEEAPKLSKKQRRLLSRMSVAQLKQMVRRPDVVEECDVTAQDPRLLVYLKSYRNTIPVPAHWSSKRRYLSGKRGTEKTRYQLPDYIAATGIATMRDALSERDDGKSLKAKARERMNPKLHKMDVDYGLLENAFFKHSTKPHMSTYGDVYYEGKENEIRLVNIIPGQLSEKLKTALGMPAGAPPPWLLNMQRYGPPRSYPNLRIPGLNAPIPAGASFGFGAGQWGKFPTDGLGRPLYAPVGGEENNGIIEEKSDMSAIPLWGVLPPEEYESEEEQLEEEPEEEEEEEEKEEATLEDKRNDKDISGILSVEPGTVTPAVPLRKGAGDETPYEEKPLYTIVEERKVTNTEGSFLAPSYELVMPTKPKKADDVIVSLNPDELESMTQEDLNIKYDIAHQDQKSDRKRKATNPADSKKFKF
ncbi:hypothetical protein WA158_001531 [Blastocystis sp. Blastoise]